MNRIIVIFDSIACGYVSPESTTLTLNSQSIWSILSSIIVSSSLHLPGLGTHHSHETHPVDSRFQATKKMLLIDRVGHCIESSPDDLCEVRASDEHRPINCMLLSRWSAIITLHGVCTFAALSYRVYVAHRSRNWTSTFSIERNQHREERIAQVHYVIGNAWAILLTAFSFVHISIAFHQRKSEIKHDTRIHRQ